MTYLWRDIDADLWAKVKAKAATERVSIRELLVQWAHAYIGGVSVRGGD